MPEYLDEMSEIIRLPNGADSDDIPAHLVETAAVMRRARQTRYPPLTAEQIATVASLLGMRTKAGT
jgi:hypothetical protein